VCRCSCCNALGQRPRRIVAEFSARLSSALLRQGERARFIQKKGDHIALLDPAIAEGLVYLGRVLVGVDDRSPVVGAKMMQDGREIGVPGENDELFEAGRMLKKIADIAGDLDVGAVLELIGERLAVDDFEPCDHEVRAHRREAVRIVGAATADELTAGIAIAARNGKSPPRILRMRFETHKPAIRDAAHPFLRISGKAPRSLFALTAQ